MHSHSPSPLMGGSFDFFDGQCKGQINRMCNAIVRCEQAFKGPSSGIDSVTLKGILLSFKKDHRCLTDLY